MMVITNESLELGMYRVSSRQSIYRLVFMALKPATGSDRETGGGGGSEEKTVNIATLIAS
jgi:hypothetical protein